MTHRSILALAGFIAAWMSPMVTARAADQVPSTKLTIPAVTVAPVQRRLMEDTLVVSGTIVARDEILVSAEIDGLRVTSIEVDEGDRVKAGQVLARLARETLDAQLAQSDASLAKAEAGIAQASSQIAQSQATLTEAQANLARTQALRQSGNATQEILDTRVALLRTAEARLAGAQDGLALARADKAQAEAQRQELLVRIGRTEIKAPRGGLVSRRTVKLGAMSAMQGDPMFRVIADGALELEAEIMDMHLPRVPANAEVRVSVGSGPVVTGRMRLLPTEVDRTSRLGKARIALPDDASLRVGAFARGEIVMARREGLAVPASAVTFDADGVHLQVVKDDKVAVRTVKTGIAAGGFVEILSGIQDGDVVVARAAAFLRDGDAIRPVRPGQARAEAPK